MNKKRLIYGTAIILAIVISSFQKRDQNSAILKKGFYKYPSVARVIMFYEVNDNKISFYRIHAGHYAAFGRYRINLNDSTLIINYNKTVASNQFRSIEPFDSDTINFGINLKSEIDLFGLTYIEPNSNEFYKKISKTIKKNSKKISSIDKNNDK
jgi:hypothetical protein